MTYVKGNRARVTVSLSPKTLSRLDEIRGLIPRSVVVEKVLDTAFPDSPERLK